jgi:hypothetical protein
MQMTVRPEPVEGGEHPVHASITQHERAHFHPFVVTLQVMTISKRVIWECFRMAGGMQYGRTVERRQNSEAQGETRRL